MNDMNKATLDYYVELIDNKLLELTRSKPELQRSEEHTSELQSHA